MINLLEVIRIFYASYLSRVLCVITPGLVLGQANQINFKPVEIPGTSPFPTVECIYQDSKGFMWVGTYDGLYRYDGYELKHFVHNPSDTQSICDNKIRFMMEDSQGYFWIGTQLGLARMDPRKEDFQNFTDVNIYPIGQSVITSLVETHEGNIWIGSHAGLFKADPNSMTFVKQLLRDDHSTICFK